MFKSIKISKEQRLYNHLAGNLQSHLLLTEVWNTWISLKRLVEGYEHVLSVPTASVAQDSSSCWLTWIEDKHFLEVEFCLGKSPLFHYKDRINGYVWEQLGPNGDKRELCEVLLLFSKLKR